MESFLDIRKIHVRITTTLSMDIIQDFVRSFTTTYLISQEDPGVHQHYHILMEYQESDPKHNKLRYSLKTKLGLNGNGSYSISTVRSRSNLMKYILKDDGVFVKSNIPDEVISLMKRCSYKKSHDKKFSRDLLTIEEDYICSKLTLNQFKKAVLKLKVSYNQNLYPSHLKAYFYKLRCKKDDEYYDEFISEFL